MALSKGNNKKADFSEALKKFEGKTVNSIAYDKQEELEIVFTDGSIVKVAPVKVDDIGIRIGVSIKVVVEKSI